MKVFLRTLLLKIARMTEERQYLKRILAAYAILRGHRGDDIAGQRDAPENCFFSAVFGWKNTSEQHSGNPVCTAPFPGSKCLAAPLH